ncbi:hypothetical protein Rhopal_001926-T1 [Rhodotorula paludigena]|uniref:Proteophosphoglycan ppg4 n=1 Tax=Rhodotorula paludigena TaxID=86838 RepID=A0AAV5G8W1_9BASI|nr:hypothetical protein Rhopal_001926-T1 [Rhodotorula paludigena]
MSNLEDLQAQLLQLIASLPEGANPFEALQGFLWASLAPDVPSSFRVQLIALACCFALTLLFVTSSLAVRIWQRTFWVLHFGDTPRLWRPHFSVSWSIWAVILLVFMEVLVIANIQYFDRNSDPTHYIAWELFAWLPAWYGGFTAAWGISVSFLLHLHTYGHADTMEAIAPYVNGAAITIPTIFTASVVPLCALATHHFSRLMDHFGELDRFLADGAATYTGRFSILSLAPAMPVLEALEAELRPFLRWFKATFAVYAGFAAFLTLILSSVALLYLFSLRRVLQQASSWSAGSNVSSSRTHRSQRKIMRQTYANLAITIGAFSLLGLSFMAVSIAIARDPRGITDATTMQVFTLVPLYAFAVLGLPTSVLLFVRSYDRSSPTSSADGVNVSVHVVSLAEGGAPPPPLPPKDCRKSTVPYASARRALALEMPEDFELVETQRDADVKGGSFDADTKDDLYGHAGAQDLDEYTFPSASLPAKQAKNPSVASLSSITSSPISPPPPPLSLAPRSSQARLSTFSMTESLRADRGSPVAYAFSFEPTPSAAASGRGLAPPVRTPRTPLTPAESLVEGRHWK